MKGLKEELYRLGLSMAEFQRFSGLCMNTIIRLDRGLPVKPATLGRVKLAFKRAEEQVERGFNRSVHWKDLRKEAG